MIEQLLRQALQGCTCGRPLAKECQSPANRLAQSPSISFFSLRGNYLIDDVNYAVAGIDVSFDHGGAVDGYAISGVDADGAALDGFWHQGFAGNVTAHYFAG
ncbi:hypothetical protein DEU29_101259 [Idiomarina aquatica]|uniref:Uncharacterized protein n=1 Tax=Idiomarina aquatica TaxID=1327752 RepID=A0A4R6PPQ6_9GAMM|nr:hypothetical protein DEU29_101259 [Idiomarina aquatica]